MESADYSETLVTLRRIARCQFPALIIVCIHFFLLFNTLLLYLQVELTLAVIMSRYGLERDVVVTCLELRYGVVQEGPRKRPQNIKLYLPILVEIRTRYEAKDTNVYEIQVVLYELFYLDYN